MNHVTIVSTNQWLVWKHTDACLMPEGIPIPPTQVDYRKAGAFDQVLTNTPGELKKMVAMEVE